MQITKEKLDGIRRELEDILYPDRRDDAGVLHLTRYDCRLDVRLRNNGGAAAGVREYEQGGKFGYQVTINPKRIRTDGQLERQVQFIKETIGD